MSGLKRSAIITASVFATAYLLAAFIAWDLDASHWPSVARGMVVIFAVGAASSACGIGAAISADKCL